MFDPEPNKFAGFITAEGFRGGYVLTEHAGNMPENSPVLSVSFSGRYEVYMHVLSGYFGYGYVTSVGIQITRLAHYTYTAH